MRHFIVMALVFLALSPATARDRLCEVRDPTGTRLNLRATPGGAVTGSLANGQSVNRAEIVDDARGRQWIFLHDPVSGDPLGWAFRPYVRCPMR